MEYGTQISSDCYNDNYTKHVGYQHDKYLMKNFFSIDTVNTISYKITELLQGVNKNNRPIIVPKKTICNIMSEIFNSYQPPTGDIYSRYNVHSGINSTNYIQNMIDQVIEIITSDVRNNLEMEENNKKLSIWTTVYGDFNNHQLRQHPPIKIRKKRPSSFQFNMNY